MSHLKTSEEKAETPKTVQNGKVRSCEVAKRGDGTAKVTPEDRFIEVASGVYR